MKLHRSTAERARAMRYRGMPEADILAAFGGKFTSSDLDKQIEALRAANRKYSKAYYTSIPKDMFNLDDRVAVTAEAIAERDRRYSLQHLSLTAALCGDPLPGMSALDRR